MDARTGVIISKTTETPAQEAREAAGDKQDTPARVYSAKETADFKMLTKATLEALAAGKQTEMVAKLTDLETAWDDKEEVLKPKNEATWMMLDKTLDKGISSLRSSRTNLQKGKMALEDLRKELELATKPDHKIR